MVLSKGVVAKLAKRRKRGETLRPVSVAETPDGHMYAVDGLDVLEAHRRARIQEVECQVTQVSSSAEALKLHLSSIRTLPHDPFAVLKAVRVMRQTDPEYPYPDEAYEWLANLDISKEAQQTFSSMLAEIDHGKPTPPTFWHVFREISKIEHGEQEEAVRCVMLYTKRVGGVPPDISAVRAIMRQFGQAEPKYDQVRPVEVIPEPAAGGDAAKPAVGSQRTASATHDSVNHTIALNCGCGNNWYVDTMNLTVREASKIGGITMLSGDSGRPVYVIPREEASYMGIDMEAPASYSRVGSERDPALVVTRSPLPPEALDKVRDVIIEYRADEP